MSTSTINHMPATNHEVTALSPSKLAILLPYALFLWCIAWSMIHFRGPHGIFEGTMGIAIYAVTIPTTVLLNRLHLKLTGLPNTQIVNCVAVTLAAATTIDGICLSFFPSMYGNNPDVLRQGAAYIIWAGAVACWLAFGTLRSAQKKSFR
jgi:hypothetical protein